MNEFLSRPNRRARTRAPGGFMLAALWFLASGAITVPARGDLVPYDLARLSRRSEYIVCGEVTALTSSWTQLGRAGRVLVTDVRIRVTESWKHPEDTPPREITVRFLGGRDGERWQLCLESPRFELGEKVLVFARKVRGRLWVTGWRQGKYRLAERDGTTWVEGRADLPIARPVASASVRADVRGFLEKAPGGSLRAGEEGK